MRRSALYSSSSPPPQAAGPQAPHHVVPPRVSGFAALRQRSFNDPRLLWSAIGLLTLLLLASLVLGLGPAPSRLTQQAIDSLVLKTLQTVKLPSAAARAYAIIAPSVVKVVGYSKAPGGTEGVTRGIGTGVVIVDQGIILTSLHVVQEAHIVQVIFANGMESAATVTGMRPEKDLAVLQAHRIPDDLKVATLRSSAHLRPGDEVLAVGFPFGIGPSASSGVVSGLDRTFEAPDGGQALRKMIQFDAAANSGNSGGPLVTQDGEVVGIVTAIFNPTELRTFIGIGFAVPIEEAAAAAGTPPF